MRVNAARSPAGSSGDLLADRRYDYAQAAMAAGDPAVAADLFLQVLERVPQWPPAWFALGRARLALAERSVAEAETLRRGAADAFEHVLIVDPADHLGAAIELALLRTGCSGQAISPAFVAGLFDGYAARFDAHLTGSLGYQAPALLREAVGRVCELTGRTAVFDRVVDLGCGTGLAAEAFRDIGKRIVGVDLSSAMIDVARRKHVYTSLFVAPLQDWMEAQPSGSANLVTAADVFAYLGDLAPIMGETARVLSPDGLVCFTVQRAAHGTYGMGVDRRYAHTRDYVDSIVVAAGLVVASIEACSARVDRGTAVSSLAVVARKP